MARLHRDHTPTVRMAAGPFRILYECYQTGERAGTRPGRKRVDAPQDTLSDSPPSTGRFTPVM
jgi:hypothetical protein